MANIFDSNFTDRINREFLTEFESSRVISREVNTQLLEGQFDEKSGERVRFKRPTDYRAVETDDGDLTAETDSDIITGAADGLTQKFITVSLNLKNVDHTLKGDQLAELVRPAARRLSTQLELNFALFARNNSALLSGVYGTPVSKWDHVAEAGAVLDTIGAPRDMDWIYLFNPFVQTKLASDQRSLGAGGRAGDPIVTAHERAMVTQDFAGMKVFSANTLRGLTSGAGADRIGALTAAPTQTYESVKDTFTQVWSVDSFEANLQIKAGERVTVTGRNRLNLSTRELIFDENQSNIEFSAVVAQDVTLDGLGAGNITIAGPAINEVDGQYNTVDTALQIGDIITLEGSASQTLQPNLFFHPQAFGIGTVEIKPLFDTDTTMITEDGISIRSSRDGDLRANKNQMRWDIFPAFAAFNQFLAGQGYGRP